MLPIEDVEVFAETVASLDAAEYVSQYLAPPVPVFTAGTLPETLAKAKQDGWGQAEYVATRQVIQHALGPSHRLLGGDEGFAPAH